jgi:hypothetical protein
MMTALTIQAAAMCKDGTGNERGNGNETHELSIENARHQQLGYVSVHGSPNP